MKNKCVIIILTILTALVASLNFSIAIKARDYVTYTADVTDTERITNIVINNTKIPLTRYVNDNIKITEQEIKGKEGEKEDVLTSDSTGTITITTSIIDNVLINYSGDLENINVYLNGLKQELDDTLYINTTSIINTIKMSINWYTAVIFIISLPVMFGLLYYIMYFMRKLKQNEHKIWQIALFVLDVFVLYFSLYYISMYSLNVITILLIMAILGCGIYYLKDIVKEHLENMYIIIVTVVGITMLFIIPPFNVPDEMAHFVKSFETSYINNDDNGYTNLPMSIQNLRDKYEEGAHDTTTKYNVKNYFSDIFKDGKYESLSEQIFSYTNTKYASVIPYLPSTIMIFVGKILNVSPLLLVLIGRFINLIITIIGSYIALKNIPCFKKVLFMVMLFPIFLHQAAAINMDWLTNLSTILIISFIFKYRKMEEKIGKSSLALLLCLAVILSFCKFGYFPVLVIILLIPNEKFKNKKEAIIFKILYIVLPTFISYLQNSGLGGMATTNNTPYYTLSYTLSHPLSAILVYIRTALSRLPLDIFRGLFDGFGVSTQWHSSLVLYTLVIIYTILIASSGHGEEKELKWKERLILIGAALIMIAIVYSAMFLNWTILGAYTIDGLQPRYFIPPVLLLFIAITNSRIKLNVKNTNLVFSLGVFVVYLLSFITIALGFY